MLNFHIKGDKIKKMNTVKLSRYMDKIKVGDSYLEFNHYEEGITFARYIRLVPGQKYEFIIDMNLTPVTSYFIKGLIEKVYNTGGLESVTRDIKFVTKDYAKDLSKVVSDAFDLLR